MKDKDLPAHVEKRLRDWFKFSRICWIGHYFFGILGTLSAITIAFQPAFLTKDPNIVSLIAWTSAIGIVMLTFLTPSRKARAYRNAWRHLNDACARYRMIETYEIEGVLDAMKEGEEIISQTEFF